MTNKRVIFVLCHWKDVRIELYIDFIYYIGNLWRRRLHNLILLMFTATGPQRNESDESDESC